MTPKSAAPVLVTGATGYIAGHVIKELLANGYIVRGTVRDTSATHKTAHLRALPGGERLEFVAADLTRDDGWAKAVDGCEYVMHVASPLPNHTPKNEDEVIRPAVDGTLRVLRACADDPGVKRVVLTSSIAAIRIGHPDDGRARTEDDWSNLDKCPVYPKSKTLAERAAWDFMADKGSAAGFELVAVNPGLVLGPLLNDDSSTSVETLRKLVNRELPGSPRLGFAVVDVRDVAIAHRLALETPAAAGNRYIVAGEHLWLKDMASILAAEFNPRGYRIPTRAIPNWVMWLAARFDKTARLALDFINVREHLSADKARRELGWSMRPVDETLIATVDSMIELGMVRDREKASARG
ncbi:SDR family oxidoreductase [Stackebrandtia nassauensis]|uniref:NAD-dependent epimerase/dehydratase n=1 Tax=Stackebrandtia nassauensis (strain DSM 44728 / CIP 108903 / NRRL B-16338 / NBRC 102104 / LLR-40K-21) TaxID=446470 RepID=D3PY20_STANL|nr:aldehyde reductase [Stackebrandtia nassauensis]ADD45349.1 NAD-dependent epimerase/dehydratase [Stackebrandtia nassauensis DSM 44728]